MNEWRILECSTLFRWIIMIDDLSMDLIVISIDMYVCKYLGMYIHRRITYLGIYTV